MKLPAVCTLIMLGLALPALAQAKTLAQLRAQLQGERGNAAFSADIRLASKSVSGKKKDPKVVKGSIAFRIDDGSRGLDVRVPAPLLAVAEKEGAAVSANADAPTPTLTALRALDPAMLHNMTDFAPALLHKLIGARLLSQRDMTSDGRALHEMRFSIPARTPREIRSIIDDFQGTLTVWLNADGMPVGVDESRHYKGSKFFIRFEFFREEAYQLEAIGRRLVVRHLHSEQGGSGLGRGTRRTLDIVLTPAAASRAGY